MGSPRASDRDRADRRGREPRGRRTDRPIGRARGRPRAASLAEGDARAGEATDRRRGARTRARGRSSRRARRRFGGGEKRGVERLRRTARRSPRRPRDASRRSAREEAWSSCRERIQAIGSVSARRATFCRRDAARGVVRGATIEAPTRKRREHEKVGHRGACRNCIENSRLWVWAKPRILRQCEQSQVSANSVIELRDAKRKRLFPLVSHNDFGRARGDSAPFTAASSRRYPTPR